MRLTVHSDYSLRVLIFLAAKQGELATIRVLSRWEREGTFATDDDGFTLGDWSRLQELSGAGVRAHFSRSTELVGAVR